MRPRTLFPALVVLSLAPPAFAQNREADLYNWQVKFRLWGPRLLGTMRGDRAGLAGTRADLRRDLGIDSRTNAFTGAVEGRLFDRVWLQAEIWRSLWHGDTRLTRPVNFNGTPFTPGQRVVTDHEMIAGGGAFEYRVPLHTGREVRLDFGFLVGFRAAYVASRWKSTVGVGGLPFNDRMSLTTALPVIGARVKFELTEWITLDVQAVGMSFRNLQSVDAEIFDAAGEVRFNLYRGFFAGVGYHFVSMRFSDRRRGGRGFLWDVRSDGPFFTIGVRW